MEAFFVVLDKLIPLAAVAIGWALSEFSNVYRSSKEKKETISYAISILLEVRFQSLALNKIISTLKPLGMPDAAALLVKEFIERSGLWRQGISEEYENAINVIAKHSPLIAYEYRSRASFPTFLSNWRKMALETGLDGSVIVQLEDRLQVQAGPKMDRLIVDLAAIHSKKVKKDVLRLIAKPMELSQSSEDMISEFKDRLTKCSKADAQNARAV